MRTESLGIYVPVPSCINNQEKSVEALFYRLSKRTQEVYKITVETIEVKIYNW